MIVAEIYKQTGGKIVAFVVRGHSTLGKHGYNVHCAEVSMLSQSAYLGIGRYLNRNTALANHEHGGLGLELTDAPDELTEAVFQTMLIGLREIEKVAPKIIHVELIEMDSTAENSLQGKIKRMTPSPRRPLPNVDIDKAKIRVEIFSDGDGKIIGFSIEERDTKIVNELKIYCASVWIQSRAAFLCLKDYLKRDIEFDSDSRHLRLNLKTPPDAVTEAVFQTMLIGLRELEKLAPQIVNVTENFPSEVKHND